MTTAAQLKANREYKARRRLIDPVFVEAEREARRAYARKARRFHKLATRFVRANYEQFRSFCRQIGIYV